MMTRIHPFDDGSPRSPAGAVFYPIEFSLIKFDFMELNLEEMAKPGVFNASAPYHLRRIAEFFKSIHDSHETALRIHAAYRSQGAQYGVYLRNYFLGGIRNPSGEDWFVGRDYRYQLLLGEACSGRHQVIGFMNPHSLQRSIPTLRVLNHNWQDIVETVVGGAKWIVMVLVAESSGTAFELEILRRLDLTSRTLVILESKTDEDLSHFCHVFESEHLPDASLKREIDVLAGDAFRQTRGVADLSSLPCHVIDRNLDCRMGQFAPGSLKGARYEDFLPSSLWTNWNLVAEHFPKMVDRWHATEKQFATAKSPGVDELAITMYLALYTFIAAATLELYHEMAVCIATVGAAHWAITRDRQFIADCYEQAASYAGWSEEPQSAEYYRNGAAEFRDPA